MNELISIIVPVYNAERTLERCIESLTKQTYRNIEIILVNDGSEDNSLYICRKHEQLDRRIIVINKKNGGVSSARNAGIDSARGNYIMFCDSDDWVEINWCEELHSLFNPNNLTMCAYFCHYANGGKQLVSSKHETVFDKEDYFALKRIGAYNPWNKIFDSSIIKDNKLLFSEKLAIGEDELFVWEYLKLINGKIVVCNTPLNHYTWPENNSLTLNISGNYYQQCQYLFERIYNDILESNGCSDVALEQFFNDCYWEFERSIRQIFLDETIGVLNKISRTNDIIKSTEFRTVVDNMNIKLNKVIELCFTFRTSVLLYLLCLIGKF